MELAQGCTWFREVSKSRMPLGSLLEEQAKEHNFTWCQAAIEHDITSMSESF